MYLTGLPFRGSNSRKRRNLSRVTQQGIPGIFLEAPSEKEQEEPRMGLACRLPPMPVCPEGPHPNPGPTLPFLSELMPSWAEDSPDG